MIKNKKTVFEGDSEVTYWTRIMSTYLSAVTTIKDFCTELFPCPAYTSGDLASLKMALSGICLFSDEEVQCKV
jgi:hypothetical protein